MIGDYSIMDLVTLSGLVGSFAAILGVFVKVVKDNQAIKKDFELLTEKMVSISNEQKIFLKNNHQILMRENQSLLRENQVLNDNDKSIKSDTSYIRDEMLAEKMARLKLYDNVSNADEILNKLDFMRELVIQNGQLTGEVEQLKVENQKLAEVNDEELAKTVSIISRFSSQLAGLEEYAEAEEIRQVLKKMLNELSDN